MHISPETWLFSPPTEDYEAWGSCGVLTRPPPVFGGVAPSVESVPPPRSLERSTSKVPSVCGDTISADNLPEFARAVAQKTLVTNLDPYLAPLTDEFRKVAG